jgi:hypothetical protein
LTNEHFRVFLCFILGYFLRKEKEEKNKVFGVVIEALHIGANLPFHVSLLLLSNSYSKLEMS